MKRSANYWPTEAQALLLRAGLLSGEAAVGAWRRVEPRLEVARLDPASQRLLPLVYANLRRHGVDEPRLADSYRTAWLWNQRLVQRMGEAVEALRRAAIPSLLLKGLALVTGGYVDLGARPMGDADLLVPEAQALAAGEVLRGLGWAPRHALTPAFISVKHAAPFTTDDGEECDVHWRVFEEVCASSADDAWWAASITVDFQDTTFRVPCPADQLLHVCVHGSKWTWVPAIRWVSDAVLIVRAGGVDWARLVAQARARRFVLRLYDTLCYLSEAMGAGIPVDTLADLSHHPPSAFERFEYRTRSREHQILGELPLYWCNYLRGRPGGLLRPLEFARYLQRAWELGSVTAVPRRAVTLGVRRLRAPRAPRLAS